MRLDEGDTPVLKTWITKRLEDISDADSDVLADYVLALVKSDEPDEQVRAVCLENLEDFLHNHAAKFVDDVLNAIRSKSYIPGYVPPKPKAAPVSASASTFVPQQIAVPGLTLQPNGSQSRKRAFHERDGGGSTDGNDLVNRGERSFKQMKRGGREPFNRGRGRGRGAAGQRGDFHSPQNMQGLSSMSPGLPPMDPNNMMAAMQAMGFPSPAQFFGQGSPDPARKPQVRDQPRRCRDYDTKGFCAAGNKCPYSHGEDYTIMPEHPSNEYDPKSSALTPSAPTSPITPSNPTFTQPSVRGSNHRGGRGARAGHPYNSSIRQQRAVFSSAGPNYDRDITSIVVEQIPEEKFSEDAVRDFFCEFGTIEDVNMQAYKRLAIVRYSDYAGAKRAYESPKVIFDNRFVKVYWYKPETLPTPPTNGSDARPNGHTQNVKQESQEDTEMLDPEEVAKKTAEAQKAHEEKMEKLKEAEAAKSELDRKIKAQAEERRKLMEKLAKKGAASPPPTTANGASSPPPVPATTNGAPAAASSTSPHPQGTTSASQPKPGDPTQTAALRAKLAELEAEAASLGLPAEEAPAPYSPYPPRGRGRGRGSRGRPFYRGGAPRGRGGWAGGAGVGAVARLDNRPKTLEVKARKQEGEEGEVDFSDDAVGEGLRAFLFVSVIRVLSLESKGLNGGLTPNSQNVGDYTTLTPSDTEPSKVTISFRERYIAESFLAALGAAGSRIEGVGLCEVKWVANPPNPAISSSNPAITNDPSEPDADSAMLGEGGEKLKHEEKDENRGGGRRDEGGEMDYDVADEEDEGRWGR
ncbi:MAG: hypothetical protein M1828_000537 [Chrysothrix sp. TS-e1954]|nr:MAG: hypothetical protein M1828_000537 [Chrysothrix sp. TS-e1954]